MGTVNTPSNKIIHCEQIAIYGIVQGVGFRPTAYKIATQLHISGWVSNTSAGVSLLVWAEPCAIDQFLALLAQQLPPMARIDNIERTPVITPDNTPQNFEILESQSGEIITGVTPDSATCPECLREINSPDTRRFGYAFSNCTQCGPRFSIVRHIPYDRANTTMLGFELCRECSSEYSDPTNRRYHAQPNACPNCGPKIWLEGSDGIKISSDNSEKILQYAADFILQGKIVAIKGIGGFHLACDAKNAAAIATLRQRKIRYQKPFALMANSVAQICNYAQVSEAEATLLQSHQAPVVILQAPYNKLPSSLAPETQTLGFMLPYSPLHHLIMQKIQSPIVLTSANLSDTPQVTQDQSARETLQGIADYYLLHNREIANRVDDSVIRLIAGKPRFYRRARGYAPEPLVLPAGFECSDQLLAMGADLKNTFCLVNKGRAIVSQHIGDLENLATFNDYRHNIALYQKLYDVSFNRVVIDKHPGYHSSKVGEQLASVQNSTLHRVQHHHAHIAACMVEHALPRNTEAVLGVALDGLGYGDDGSFWGGEFLMADYQHTKRLGYLSPIAMLGGERAMHEPWRNTLAHLFANNQWQALCEKYSDNELLRWLQQKPIDTLQTMSKRNINSPLTTSTGRLFDAVAAALNYCRSQQIYEGQAATQLEAAAMQTSHHKSQNTDEIKLWEIVSTHEYFVLSFAKFWHYLFEAQNKRISTAAIAWQFHESLARGIATMAKQLCKTHQLNTIVLSGGVIQNKLLLERLLRRLEDRELKILVPEIFPANDGGISLGQAVIALAQNQGTE